MKTKPSIVATVLQLYKRQWEYNNIRQCCNSINNSGMIYRDLIFSKNNPKLFPKIFPKIFPKFFSEISSGNFLAEI